MVTDNIYPDFTRSIPRELKEHRLNQKGLVIWFTGLSGSGKSTLTYALERELFYNGYFTRVLDGDNIRYGINNNLGFSSVDRTENIRRIAEVAKLFAQSGIITLAAFISPTNEIRTMARDIIGKEDFLEVHVSTPLLTCEERDIKGLYAKARQGIIKDFTGISAPYEIPEHPDYAIDTTGKSVPECVGPLIGMVIERVREGREEQGKRIKEKSKVKRRMRQKDKGYA